MIDRNKVPKKRKSIPLPQGFVLKEALKTAISTDKHAQLSQTDKMDITPFDKAVSGNPVVQGTLVGVGVSVAAPALVTAGGTALLVTESSAALSIGGGVVEGIVKTAVKAPNDFYIIPIPLSQTASDVTQFVLFELDNNK